MDELQTLITNIGFPIVACIYMAKQQNKMNTILTDLITTLKMIEKNMTSMDSEIKSLKQETQRFKIPKELREWEE